MNATINNLEEKIIETLIQNGYEAYYVGGYVRDKLLGIESYDKDITTNASYEQAKACLSHLGNVEEVGKNFGVIMVSNVEVAQFRGETYSKTSKPDVKLVSTAKEDSDRRDFTINALYMTLDGKIIDYHNGQEDMKNKIIRCVGNPDERFKDDPSRIVRGFYLASKLGFDIEQKTKESMQRNSHLLKLHVPEELKGKLIMKAIKGGNFAQFINMIMEVGLMDSFIPELSHLWNLTQNPKYHQYHENAWYHVVDVVKEAEKMHPKDAEFILSALFHDVAKGLPNVRGINKHGMPNDIGHEEAGVPIAREVITRLGLGKGLAKKVEFYVEFHGLPIIINNNGKIQDKSISKIVKKTKNYFTNKNQILFYLNRLCEFRLCDSHSMTNELRTKSLETNNIFPKLLEDYLSKYLIYVSELPINGKDILNNNEKITGKYIKICLDYLIMRNIQDREKAIQIISNLKTQTLDNFYANM